MHSAQSKCTKRYFDCIIQPHFGLKSSAFIDQTQIFSPSPQFEMLTTPIQNFNISSTFNYPNNLQFNVIKKCATTKARLSHLILPHGLTPLPTFMPVATQASIKGLTYDQINAIGISLILNNTYHLSLRPGTQILDQSNGVHNFQSWNSNLLSDSGGFQMVSLSKLTKVTEDGVEFQNPFDQSNQDKILLTPERSIEIQQSLGTDIIMQLDDVVSSTTPDPERVEEAMQRSIRWLDRCIQQHFHPRNLLPPPHPQSLFAIIQGGLSPKLRSRCLDAMTHPARMSKLGGYAIGGLSGGESKNQFWRIIHQCTHKLPELKPRYCMGIGYSEDLVVAVALGIDMADCVFPTRTARFGVALTFKGPLKLFKRQPFERDFAVIDSDCGCLSCQNGNGQSRSFLFQLLKTNNPVAIQSITAHNLFYQSQLMEKIRTSIAQEKFPQFLIEFFHEYYAGDVSSYP
ncbi:hypothetical protein O181_071731, partial [Austropuccinia psidii MF-1]|nr:hypothetical protein [Austropuccinia psidii MF-1]